MGKDRPHAIDDISPDESRDVKENVTSDLDRHELYYDPDNGQFRWFDTQDKSEIIEIGMNEVQIRLDGKTDKDGYVLGITDDGSWQTIKTEGGPYADIFEYPDNIRDIVSVGNGWSIIPDSDGNLRLIKDGDNLG